MVGEEQQRNADAKVMVRTCRVVLGIYTAAPNHFQSVVLPFKKVLAVSKINATPQDTWTFNAIRVVAPNIMRYHANVAATGNELTGPTDVGNAEVVVVLPHK
jgi:hypothetical protein